MNNPLVSVIIPMYNAEKYIGQAIESVIKQTYTNWELLIINDGSNDHSSIIANSYTNHKVRLIEKNNGGASTARNFGLNLANGDFIQFLDADDFISADKFENQIRLSIKNPKKLIVCSTIHFHSDDCLENLKPSSHEEKFLYDTNDPIAFLTNLWGGYNGKMSMVQPNAWLSPKSVIEKAGKWDESLSLDDDGEFFCRVILNSQGIIRDINSKNFYRKFHDGTSLSGSQSRNALVSQFNSNVSKEKELLSRLKNKYTQKAIANLFQTLCLVTFINEKEIYNMSLNRLKKLDTSPNVEVIIGGKVAQLLVKVFGWRNAKRFINFIKMVINK